MRQLKALRMLLLVAVPLGLSGSVARTVASRPWTLPHSSQDALIFSPDGRWFITADFRCVWRWDRRTHERQVILEPPPIAAHIIGSFWGVLAVSPDSRTLAYHSSLDQSILLLPVTAGSKPGQPQQTLRYGPVPGSSESGIEALLFSPDGRLLVMAESENVRVWEVQAKLPRLLWQRAFPDTLENHAVRFFQGRNVLLLSREDGGALCEARTGKTLRTLPHTAPASLIAVTADGTIRASREAQSVVLTDVSSGRRLKRFALPQRDSIVAFSPGGKLLAAGGEAGSVTIWRVATGVKVRSLRNAAQRMYGLHFSPNGNALAVTSNDWRVRVWPLK